MSPMFDPLTARVGSTPDRTAVVDAATGAAWRYDELDEAVTSLAGRLAGLGLDPGDHLGMLAGTSTDAVTLVHAAWRRGLRLVPLSVRLAEAELARQAARVDLDALACVGDTAEKARSVADAPVVSVEGVGVGGPTDGGGDGRPDDPIAERADSATEPADADPIESIDPEPGEPATWRADDPAVAMFTSGTTAEPKAVTLTMGNLLASATASAFRLGVLPTDRWLLCLPVYHMGGLAPVLRTAVYGTALIVQERRSGFDPEAVARATAEHGATGLSLVPTQLDRILDADAALAETVRTVLVGGAPAPRALIERCGRHGVPVYPTYGLTETASQVATATPEQAFERPDAVGQPLLGTRVTVVDDELEPVPAGQTGEIVVSGPTVTPGYYDDPAATERAFCEHGLRTGDVGRVDDVGRLRVAGRRDDRIVTGGENVDPTAVEVELRAHAAVSDVAVVGIDDPEWGERVAALVVADGREPEPDDLLAHARARLADFEVPKTLRFADALPRTASGTVDREAVRRALRE